MMSDMEGYWHFLNSGTEEAQPPGPGGSLQDLSCQSKHSNPLPQTAGLPLQRPWESRSPDFPISDRPHLDRYPWALKYDEVSVTSAAVS